MSDYVFTPPAVPVVPVEGGGQFPVRRIFCIGQNYADHAVEMGSDPSREPPFFFTKPADALVIEGEDTPYPSVTADLHHEIELVVALGAGGRDVAPEAAAGLVFGYAAGLDLTRRDLQTRARNEGRPWDMAKGFDHSAPIGAIRKAGETHPTAGAITLTVNGRTKQSGNIDQLIWKVPEAIALLSSYVELMPGDLIFTGTPAGVGSIARGDLLEGEIAGVGSVVTRVV